MVGRGNIRKSNKAQASLRCCDTRESATSSRALAGTGWEDMRERRKSDTMALTKHRFLSLVLLGVSLGALSGCVARRTKAAFVSYSQVLKPGMTRRDVEDYFRANKVQFSQMCCVEATHKHSLDDLIKIGTQHFPVPCGDESYYVAFVFNDQTQHPPARILQADDLDTLRSITTFHWVDDCF
jgi:hypothetical protein